MTITNLDKVPENIKEEITKMGEAIPDIVSGVTNISYISYGGSARILSFDRAGERQAIKIISDTRVDNADAKKALQYEYDVMSKLRDVPGVVNVYEQGDLPTKNNNLFYIMDFADYCTLKHALANNLNNFPKEITISNQKIQEWFYLCLSNILDALCEIHKRGYCHLDIKEQNILLFSDGSGDVIPKLSDFGSASKISNSNEPIEIEVTYSYAPRDWQDRSRIKSASSHQRVPLSVKQSEIQPWVDLHMLRITLYQIFRDDPDYGKIRANFHGYFTDLLLTFGDILGRESRMPKSLIVENCPTALKCLENGDDPEIDLADLIGTGVITDSINKEISYYSSKIQRITNTSLFRRLQGVRQLSLTKKVYHNAAHNRYDHSLGVFQNACDIINQLLSVNGSPLLRIFATKNEIVETVLGALLHDLGQYPYAHYLEGHFPFINHAELTEEILEGTPRAVRLFGDKQIKELHSSIRSLGKTNPNNISQLLKLARTHEGPKHFYNPIRCALGTILDGPLDADKMDYLRRDSHECYDQFFGLIDEKKLTNNFTINTSASAAGIVERFVLSVKEPARIAAELVAVARYAMFSTVYLHDHVRSYAAMARRGIVLGFRELIRGMSTKDRDTIISQFLNASEDSALDFAINTMKDNNLRIYYKLLSAVKEDNRYLPLAEVGGENSLAFAKSEELFCLTENEDCEAETKRYIMIEDRVRQAASEVIGRQIRKGELVVDVPRRAWDKSSEFARMAVIDDFRQSKPVGNLWEAIIDKVQSWVMKTRVFIAPKYQPCITEERHNRMGEKLIDILTSG